MSGDSATVLCYWNNNNTYRTPEVVDCSGVKSQPIQVNIQISYTDLLQEIIKLTRWDKVSTVVRIYGRCCRHSPLIRSKETPIVNEQSWSALLDTFQCEKANCIELYLYRGIPNEVVKKPVVPSNENVLNKSHMRPIHNVTLGPRDMSILKLQEAHRSSDIWEKKGLHEKKGSRCGSVWIPHQNLHCFIMDAGFIGIMQTQALQIDHALMTALAERWRQETHTFHFPVGEMTVTLENVGMLFGLPLDGKAVTGSHSQNWANLCSTHLGLIPGENDLTGSGLQTYMAD